MSQCKRHSLMIIVVLLVVFGALNGPAAAQDSLSGSWLIGALQSQAGPK